MKKLLLTLSLILFIGVSYTQHVVIDSTAFSIHHGELSFFLDKDTNSYISVHNIDYKNIIRITGERSDKWHKEKPFGPYNKNIYTHTGYDLGHLTPSNITSYNDSTNYISFSLFNQAPQVAAFNRGKWSKLEAKVVKTLTTDKTNAIIVTGVIYNNNKKKYLNKSRIKIPMAYYKIVITTKITTCWMGSNINGQIITTDIKTILEVARKNGNKLNITITN
jgi:DNA/RNA endonuclease G (NUC1)